MFEGIRNRLASMLHGAAGMMASSRGTDDFANSYEAATRGRRGRNWYPGGLTGTRAIIREGKLLRDRARHLVRNNAWGRSGVWTWESECIGTGIRPRFKLKDPKLRERIQHLWDAWTVQADADEVLDFYGMQASAMRNLVESGELFIRLRPRRPGDGLVVPLQLQMVEADQVPLNREIGGLGLNRVIAGVEFDPIGKRVAYHMFRRHPDDPQSGIDGVIPVRVPAGSVIHVYKPWRIGDVRGTTWFSNILLKLFDLDKYDDAELLRKQVAALLTGFIFPSADDDRTPLLNETDDDADQDASGADREVRLEAGTLHVMEEAGDLKMAEPADVGGSYEAFLKFQLQAIAVGLGLPFELLTGDLSNVNFTSMRAGLMVFRRKCLQLQKHVINHQLNRRVATEWLRQAILAGALPSMSTMEFNEIILRTSWIGQGFEWVQPVHEQEADMRAVRGGFKSRAQVITENGQDPEDLDNEIAEDNARADALGLVFDSDARKVSKAGLAQASDPLLNTGDGGTAG